MTTKQHFTFSIFDADPNESGEPAWPTHDGVSIEAATDAEALGAVRATMAAAADGLHASDGYTAGQMLHANVWDADGFVIGSPTYQITAEDLGIRVHQHVADEGDIEPDSTRTMLADHLLDQSKDGE